jgi:hypothetical protein
MCDCVLATNPTVGRGEIGELRQRRLKVRAANGQMDCPDFLHAQ